MTAPIEPTPVAPVTEPTTDPVVPAPVDPTIAPTTFDPATLSPEAKAYFKAQLDANDMKARTTSKNNARLEIAQQISKALGLPGDEPPDATELAARVEQAQASAWRNGVELQVHRMATRLGGNPDALLDSLSFLDSLDEMTEDDPRSPEFATALEAKVTEALARNPGYKAAGTTPVTPRPDPSQGARGAGPDLDSRIAEAKSKGDFRTVIALENQKFAKTN